MNLELNGKRALVTGSTNGIGAAIAARLAAEGADVVVHGRDTERATAVAERITAASEEAGGGRAHVVIADVTTGDGAGALAAEAADVLGGGVDVLVNNVGGADGLGAWLDTPVEAWLHAYELNVLPAVRLVQALTPGMRDRGWGRILQVASGVATQPDAVGADYAAAKAAMVNMTVSLAKALTGTGVTANTVAPGPVHTATMERAVRSVAEDRGWSTDSESLLRHAREDLWPNPTGRVGEPEEVAAAVAFLASPLAAYVTGANLRVDGGTTVTVN